MNIRFSEIRDELKKLNSNSKAQVSKYENTKCWSYAYLSRWVVLERGLKLLYDSHNKNHIRTQAIEWLNYLDGKLTKVPSKIKDFSVQTRIIPQYNLIESLLGQCKHIKVALNSNEKYRPKRNRIAHKAEEFKSEENYQHYKKVIDDAIKQLLSKLSQKAITNEKYQVKDHL